MKKVQEAPMDLTRWAELLDAYGADLERMPHAERARARALLGSDARAAELHARAAQLDSLLDAVPAFEPKPSLRARVAELPLRHPHATRAGFWPWPGVWRLVAAGALAGMLGVLGGSLTTDDSSASDDEGWDELASVAFVAGIEGEP